MDEKTSLTVHCPRCGGLMYKPENSLFYWHADNNHPPCDITNVVVAEPKTSIIEEPIAEPEPPRSPGDRRQKKR